MNNKNLELAQFVLEKGTYFFGTDISKVDSASFFIDSIQQELGLFEKEIKEFVDLLQRLRIIDKVSYVEARTINPEITGYAYECEINVPRMKEFIKRGAGGLTSFDESESSIYFGFDKLRIPRNTDQFYFCKKMYEYPASEWVSWDIVYEEMQGVEKGLTTTKPEKDWWKVVYDTMSEINKKAKKIFNIGELFRYEKKEFMRTI